MDEPIIANDITVPDILPPAEDGIFRTLLTHPDAKPVLKDVVSSVLMIPIRDIEVRNTELPISDINDKRERFDVNCRTDSGEQVEVEMQSDALESDSAANSHAIMINRVIFNLCDLHSSQSGKGIRYDKLMRSFQITFCGYTILPELEGFVNSFSWRNKDGYELSDTNGIVFVELTKLGKVLKKPVENMTPIEMWSVFFSRAHKPEYKALMEKITATRGEIKMANELLMSISSDEIQRAHYRSRRGWQMDREHEQTVWLDQGELRGKREIAKNAVAMNMSTEQIAKLTGLTVAEIKALR